MGVCGSGDVVGDRLFGFCHLLSDCDIRASHVLGLLTDRNLKQN